MKKCFVAAICAITVLFTACGNANSNGAGDSAEVERLKNEIANLQEENKALQEGNQQSGNGLFGENGAEETDEAASWTDDTVVTFTDELFHNYIRETIGVPEGPITYGMVKNITNLELGGYYENWDSYNLEQLKWFTGLKSLHIDLNSQGNDDIWLPSSLTQLVDVEISWYGDSEKHQLRIPPRLDKIESINLRYSSGFGCNDTLNDIAQLPSAKSLSLNVFDINTLDMEALTKISQMPTLEEFQMVIQTNIESDGGGFHEVSIVGVENLRAFIDDPQSYIEQQLITESASAATPVQSVADAVKEAVDAETQEAVESGTP